MKGKVPPGIHMNIILNFGMSILLTIECFENEIEGGGLWNMECYEIEFGK